MAEVVLIPTGAMEHAALAPALERLFVGHNFVSRPRDRHRDGFTSVDVRHIPDDRPDYHNIDELAAELVAAVSPGRTGQPADFVMVIEDLELAALPLEVAVWPGPFPGCDGEEGPRP